MKKESNVITKVFSFFENNYILSCIRNGLLVIMPFILLASFSSVIYNLPIDGYQKFIIDFAGGFIYQFFYTISNSVFEYFTLLLTGAITYFYIKKLNVSTIKVILIILLTVSSLLIITDNYSTTGVILGIFLAIFIPYISNKLINIKVFKIRSYAPGTSGVFHDVIELLFPVIVVLLCSGILHLFNFYLLPSLGNALSKLFNKLGHNLAGTILLEIVSHLLWGLGIHGSNVFGAVTEGLTIITDPIFNKTFLDCFVLIGGSGCGLGLIISIFIASKQKKIKDVAKQSLFPSLFNVNEILLFGVPIVLNPILIIPFILSPIAMIIVAFMFIKFGACSIVQEVNWTTPIFFSGFLATNSWIGILIQVINLAISVLIYIPFIRMYDKTCKIIFEEKVSLIFKEYQRATRLDPNVSIFTFNYSFSGIARTISQELKKAIENETIFVEYQPIVSNEGKIVALEALLRWKTVGFTSGYLSPKLLVTIAKEEGYLYDLHLSVFKRILQDKQRSKLNCKISINVDTPIIFYSDFDKDIINLIKQYELKSNEFIIELQEDAILNLNPDILNKIDNLYNEGFEFAIDDFSVDAESLKYIHIEYFSFVKIDGSITSHMLDNSLAYEIIKNVIDTANMKNFKVLCEFVESKELYEELIRMGVDYLQGWYISRSMPYEAAIRYVTSKDDIKKDE